MPEGVWCGLEGDERGSCAVLVSAVMVASNPTNPQRMFCIEIIKRFALKCMKNFLSTLEGCYSSETVSPRMTSVETGDCADAIVRSGMGLFSEGAAAVDDLRPLMALG